MDKSTIFILFAIVAVINGAIGISAYKHNQKATLVMNMLAIGYIAGLTFALAMR